MANTDVQDLQRAELPRGRFPAEGREPFRVYFDPEVHAGVWEHARRNTEVEICGVLVGKWEQDEQGPFALLQHLIRCEQATQKHAEVTFTQESWTHINHEMDTRYQELRIVGWYHSHPDFGIFLSDRDCFIQEHFFGSPGQIAFVVDPIRNLEGVFAWRAGKPQSMPHYWVGSRIVPGEQRPPDQQTPRPVPAAPSEESTDRPAGSVTAIPGDSGWGMYLLAAAALLIGLLAGNWWTATSGELELQRRETNMAANYVAFKMGRIGLEQELARTQQDLSLILKSLPLLEASAGESEQALKTRQQILRGIQEKLQEVQTSVLRMKELYGHTPQQQRVIDDLLRRIEGKAGSESKLPAEQTPGGAGASGRETSPSASPTQQGVNAAADANSSGAETPAAQ